MQWTNGHGKWKHTKCDCKYRRRNMLLKSHFKSIQTQQHVSWSVTNVTSALLHGYLRHLIGTRCAETLMPACNQRGSTRHTSQLTLDSSSCSRRRLYGVTFVYVLHHGTVSIGVVVFGFRLVVCILQTMQCNRVAITARKNCSRV